MKHNPLTETDWHRNENSLAKRKQQSQCHFNWSKTQTTQYNSMKLKQKNQKSLQNQSHYLQSIKQIKSKKSATIHMQEKKITSQTVNASWLIPLLPCWLYIDTNLEAPLILTRAPQSPNTISSWSRLSYPLSLIWCLITLFPQEIS